MSSWHSPGSIYNISHREAAEVFKRPVQVQEKVDGSFFAFGSFVTDLGNGETTRELRCRSKGAMIYPEAPPAMFRSAVETAKRLHDNGNLMDDWTYRGECLAKPKHNSLAYARAPEGNVILFDILVEEETYINYDGLVRHAGRLRLEVVPQLWIGDGLTPDQLRSFLDTTSILGGQKIEGVVIKPLEPVYGPDKKLLMAKFVSEHFREVHTREWAKENPSGSDILALIAQKYATPARWDKAIIHLRERGVIDENGSVRDIGPLIKEIPADIWKEEYDAINIELMKWARQHLTRLFTRGFPEYYKQRLMEEAFELLPHDTTE